MAMRDHLYVRLGSFMNSEATSGDSIIAVFKTWTMGDAAP